MEWKARRNLRKEQMLCGRRTENLTRQEQCRQLVEEFVAGRRDIYANSLVGIQALKLGRRDAERRAEAINASRLASGPPRCYRAPPRPLLIVSRLTCVTSHSTPSRSYESTSTIPFPQHGIANALQTDVYERFICGRRRSACQDDWLAGWAAVQASFKSALTTSPLNPG